MARRTSSGSLRPVRPRLSTRASSSPSTSSIAATLCAPSSTTTRRRTGRTRRFRSTCRRGRSWASRPTAQVLHRVHSTGAVARTMALLFLCLQFFSALVLSVCLARRLGGVMRQLLTRVLALFRYFLQRNMLETRPHQAYRHDAQERDQQQCRRAAHSGFRGYAEEVANGF